LGFAGVEMVRRLIGVAHVEDFLSIEDVGLRGKCEGRALEFAQVLLLEKDLLLEESIAKARQIIIYDEVSVGRRMRIYFETK
jgi:5-methylthioribose kinase